MPDVTAITIRTNTGDVLIINIYADCTHSDSIRAIRNHLQKRAAENGTQERNMEGITWLGDFRGFQQTPPDVGRAAKLPSIHEG
jgi:hypothetical protein